MLGQELRHDSVLALDFGFKLLDLLQFGRAAPGRAGALESRRAILEKRLLPEVEKRGLDLVLLANLRDRLLVDEVLAQDFDFVFG